jgi:hypothetical protein
MASNSEEPCRHAIMTAAYYTALLVRKVGIRDAVLGMSASRGILSPLDVDIQRWARRAKNGSEASRRPGAEGADDRLTIVETQEALAAALTEVMRSTRFYLGNRVFNLDFGRGVITVRKEALRDFCFECRIFLSELHP